MGVEAGAARGLGDLAIHDTRDVMGEKEMTRSAVVVLNFADSMRSGHRS
jgi:hypothetical protein